VRSPCRVIVGVLFVCLFIRLGDGNCALRVSAGRVREVVDVCAMRCVLRVLSVHVAPCCSDCIAIV